jgi:hypothetical protein
MKPVVRIAFILSLLLLVCCGRYAPPIPPERLGPKPLEFVDLLPLDSSIKISWLSPVEDMRGEELKYLDDFLIYRKEIKTLKDIQDDDKPFELMATIPDTALDVLGERRAEARELGKPVGRVKLTDEERKVWYEDFKLEPDHVYVYKVVPRSERFGEAKAKRLLKVVFRGLNSDIKLFNSARFEEESLVDESPSTLTPASDGLI